MPKTFEKDFISYCNNQELEVNPNQIAVIKKIEQFYQSNFKSFFSKLFSKQNSKKGFYLFGGVGVGKTMILNFLEQLKTINVFMSMIRVLTLVAWGRTHLHQL